MSDIIKILRQSAHFQNGTECHLDKENTLSELVMALQVSSGWVSEYDF